MERRFVVKLKKVGMAIAAFWMLLVAWRPAEAGLNIGLGINIDLPIFTFQAPPELVVIPGSYVYYVPDVDVDILFYEGHWYRYWNDRWHRSRHYNGPWASIGPSYVPAPFLRLPPDYRHRAIHKRMHYDDVNRHWRRWEKERYWEQKYDWWRERREAEHDHRDGRRRDERRDDHRERRDDHRDDHRDDRGRSHGRGDKDDWHDRR